VIGAGSRNEEPSQIGLKHKMQPATAPTLTKITANLLGSNRPQGVAPTATFYLLLTWL